MAYVEKTDRGSYDLVIFDPDGTLVDSKSTFLKWWNSYVMNNPNLELPCVRDRDKELAREITSIPMSETLRNHGADGVEIYKAVLSFHLSLNHSPNYRTSPLFEGARKLIRDLSKAGIMSGLLSTMRTSGNARETLDYVQGYFVDNSVIGRDSIRDYDLFGAERIFNDFRGSFPWIKSMVYVASTEKGFRMAKEANVPFIWTGYGWETPSVECPLVAKDISSLTKLLVEKTS